MHKKNVFKKYSLNFILILLYMYLSAAIFANGSPKLLRPINASQIAEKVSKHMFDYMHFKLLGTCVWLQCHDAHCHLKVTPELDEYLPDLVESVYTKKVMIHFGKRKNPLIPLPTKQEVDCFNKF